MGLILDSSWANPPACSLSSQGSWTQVPFETQECQLVCCCPLEALDSWGICLQLWGAHDGMHLSQSTLLWREASAWDSHIPTAESPLSALRHEGSLKGKDCLDAFSQPLLQKRQS